MGVTAKGIRIDGKLLGEFTPSSIPVANFTGTPTSGTIPLTVNFTDTSTNSPTSWLWDFKNDGTATSTQQNPTYTYSSAGTYTVKLTATNSSGSNSVTKTAFITANNVAPVAGFSGTPTSGTIPLSVAFTNNSTGTNLTYLWDFKNDGTATSTATNPTYSYSSTGTFTVKLTASNSAGVSTSTRVSYITASDVVPIANISANPTSGDAPLAVTFNSGSSVGTNLTYAWDFTNDGIVDTSTTVTTATYTYSNAGTYSVKLTASNSAGVSTATSINLISVAQPMDPQFNYTSMLIGGQGSNNQTNATFLDSSSNNFTVTNVGTVTQGAFSPFGVDAGYWSTEFTGNGTTYVSAPSNAAFAFGTGDFTVEAWIYPNFSAFNSTIVGCLAGVTVDWVVVRNLSGNIEVRSSAFSTLTSSGTAPLNTWTHVAVTRSGTTLTIWLNGVSSGTSSTSGNIVSIQNLMIGNGLTSSGGSRSYGGYISNVRVVKGTAVYTAGFNPSTTPLTAISGTSILTCQSNRFIDNSSNAFAITAGNGVPISSFGPFVPVSQYVAADGGAVYLSSSYATVPTNAALNLESGDFTIESWVYIPAAQTPGAAIVASGVFGPYVLYFSSAQTLVFFAGSGGSSWAVNGLNVATTLVTNTWHHVAITRSGSTFTSYLNGSRVATASSSASLTSGASTAIGYYSAALNGYLSGLRIVKGTAVYSGATYTVPTAPVTAISGTSLLLNFSNAGMFDSTGKSTVTGFGDVKISTAQKKYGSSSIAFDGTGDYLSTVVANTNFQLRSGDFTIEMWIRPSVVNVAQAVFDQRNPNNQDAGFAIYIANTGVPIVGTANVNYITSASALSANTWYHIAVSRSGNDMKLFVDGTQVGSTYNASSRDFTNSITLIGSGANGAFNGYIQDFRFTKGYARYTSSGFPPPGNLIS